MRPFEENIRKILTKDAADQLLEINERLNLPDSYAEERLAFSAAVLMLGERYPSAYVALGAIKSIEDTELITALSLLGQSLALMEKQEEIGEAVSTVIIRGLKMSAQRLMINANTLNKEEKCTI